MKRRIGPTVAVPPCAAWCLALATAACAAPDRRPAAFLVAGMTPTNNPGNTDGDDDNLSGGAGARLPLASHVTARVDFVAGDLAAVWLPSLSYDFRLAGDGLGAIDAHVCVGWTLLSARENNVLGNVDALALRIGAEGYLVGGLLGGVALAVTPLGYDHEDAALAGLFYVGVCF